VEGAQGEKEFTLGSHLVEREELFIYMNKGTQRREGKLRISRKSKTTHP